MKCHLYRYFRNFVPDTKMLRLFLIVQKHEMIADFEQLCYTSEMLVNTWDGVSETYQQLRNSNFAMNELFELVNWIRFTSLSQLMFPGTSLGQLLISKPD